MGDNNEIVLQDILFQLKEMNAKYDKMIVLSKIVADKLDKL